MQEQPIPCKISYKVNICYPYLMQKKIIIHTLTDCSSTYTINKTISYTSKVRCKNKSLLLMFLYFFQLCTTVLYFSLKWWWYITFTFLYKSFFERINHFHKKELVAAYLFSKRLSLSLLQDISMPFLCKNVRGIQSCVLGSL